jgi:hypothetical protein
MYCYSWYVIRSCYCVLLMKPSRLKFVKLKLRWCQSYWDYFSKLYVDTKSDIKIPRPLSQATAYNHPNVLTSTLLLSEGCADEVWKPSNNGRSFSPLTIKCNNLGKTFPRQRGIVGSVAFYTVTVVSNESRRLVVPRNSCYKFNLLS